MHIHAIPAVGSIFDWLRLRFRIIGFTVVVNSPAVGFDSFVSYIVHSDGPRKKSRECGESPQTNTPMIETKGEATNLA